MEQQPKSNESIIKPQEQMISIITTINEDISQNVPQSNKEFHIYIKYNKDKSIFKIFITINIPLNNKEQNQENIYHFLILINQDYPSQPPVLYCISHVYIYFLNIYINLYYRTYFLLYMIDAISEVV